MISSLSMEEESFCEGFGDILIARYADNCLYDPQESLTDEAAVVFARYLRAARSNANLSQAELAAQAGIPEAEVVALEHGIILSTKIKEESLLALAKALDEDIESFTLVLGWGIPRPGRSGIPAKLCRAWNAGVAFMGSTRNLLLVLTLMSMHQ
jgi:transcriptional regulator with XRE-family HTH domain